MSLSNEKLTILEELKNNTDNVPQFTQELSDDAEFLLEALNITVNVLPQVSRRLRENKEFMLLAIEKKSYAFVYASEELQDDEEVVLAALKKDSSLIFHASDRLKADESFMIKATKRNSWFPIIKFSKLLKNNLLEGISDTFAIMYGDYCIATRLDGGEISFNRLKYGLVDMTLIPLISNAFINYGYPAKLRTFRYMRDEENFDDKRILRNMVGAIGIGLQAIRWALAFLATVIAIPFVVLVHAFKLPYVYYQQSKLFALEGELYREGAAMPVKTATFGDFAKQTNSSLNDFCLGSYHATHKKDITSLSLKNTDSERYGPWVSTRSLLFFRPTNEHSTTQKAALQVVKDLEINEPYNINNFEEIAIGRTFI
ncbi:DUF4116 domain-containing protein [Legionella lytica]|uniref:DUF4116 domain-containing protein n=1 Tax=Legionella lytica TaxID=96232 RepID=A0ABW8DBM2_9GAMM